MRRVTKKNTKGLDSQAMYKYPGKNKFDLGKFDYIAVHQDEVKSYLKKGWSESMEAAMKKKRVRPKPKPIPEAKFEEIEEK